MNTRIRTITTVAAIAVIAGLGAVVASSAATPAINVPIAQNKPAPDFTGIDKWLNSEPLTLQALRGKVVLVDFWTYSCIN